MEVISGISIILFWITLVALSRFITTTIHELGHAIPALMFTDKYVEIHISSYGDVEHSAKISLGRLSIYYRFDLFRLNMGLTRHTGVQSMVEQLVVVLGGPLATLIASLILVRFMTLPSTGNNTIIILSLFVLSFAWDFFVNIIPQSGPIQLSDGSYIYNDGKQLTSLLKRMKQPVAFFEGEQLFLNGEYKNAIQKFEDAINEKGASRELFRMLAQSHFQLREYDKSMQWYEKLKKRFGLREEDFKNIGDVLFSSGNYNEAIKSYNKAIHESYQNAEYLNARGYSFIQLGEYEKAIKDFNSANHYDPGFQDAYHNRALARIRTHDVKGAMEDLEISKKINDQNPYIYLHLGFYYEKIGDRRNALDNFKKAKALNIEHHGMDFMISEYED